VKIYLSSRRSRRDEMRLRRDELIALGHEVLAPWLDSNLVLEEDAPAAEPGDAGGGHDAGEGSDMSLGDARDRITVQTRVQMNRAKIAEQIYADILDCEGLVVFTDAMNHTREEAYAEYAGALFQGKRVWIVGQRFHTLHFYRDVQAFSSFQDFLVMLAALEKGQQTRREGEQEA